MKEEIDWRRTRKILESKLCGLNLIKEINICAVSYTELKKMYSQNQKIDDDIQGFIPRDIFERLYIKRNEEGRGLGLLLDCTDDAIHRLTTEIFLKVQQL